LRTECWGGYSDLKGRKTDHEENCINCELHDLFSSLNIVRMIKSRRMRWAGHARILKNPQSVFLPQVSHPYSTTDKITVLYILILFSLYDGQTKDFGLNDSKHSLNLICSSFHRECHSDLLVSSANIWGPKGRDHWEDLGICGRITLRWTLRRLGSMGRTGFGWLRIESDGKFLWMR
jgi:hypothetical protein